MSNPCLKTGCWMHDKERNEWLYGDLHACGRTYIMRVYDHSVELEPPMRGDIPERIWITFHTTTCEFRDKQGSVTMLTRVSDYVTLHYVLKFNGDRYAETKL